jgi:hypothetical protein
LVSDTNEMARPNNGLHFIYTNTMLLQADRLGELERGLLILALVS